MKSRFSISCCCSGGGGGGTPTPGFGICCANALPGSISVTFTFRPGTNSATYGNIYQNTTLTFMPTPPSPFPSPTHDNRFWSPVLFDLIGLPFRLSIFCLTTNTIVIIQCDATTGTCSSGTTVGWNVTTPGNACTTFLLSQIQNVPNSVGYGAAGDNAIAS
jgi:hypothetical protein